MRGMGAFGERLRKAGGDRVAHERPGIDLFQ